MKSRTQKLVLAVALALTTTLAWGCGSAQEFIVTGAEGAAGVDGTIIIDEADGNSTIEIDLRHLPPASRFGDGNKVFVVWFIAKDQSPVAAGKLDYNGDERRGKLEATTPHRSLEVRITAEKSSAPASPGEALVVSKKVAL